ncbi:hypothetical protein [Peribacillus frigoritolerans]|nr:hypothetical protein [Peribacillus frigoritolerans]MCK2018484.1 hypothetical protein [Peribacillus frigoritolerans]
MEGTSHPIYNPFIYIHPIYDLERYQPDCRVKKEGAAMAPSFFAIWEDLQ